MWILAGTILILIGVCMAARGLYEEKKDGEKPDKETEG